MRKKHWDTWSIGIYKGNSPFDVVPVSSVNQPALSVKDLDDPSAGFVADPFMITNGGQWYMFFEVYNNDRGKGEIGVCVSEDTLTWTYKGIALTESFHLSYPFIFQYGDDIFMVPETIGAGAVRVYRASSFPFGWEYKMDLIQGSYADPTLVYYNYRWWLFVCSDPYNHSILRLFSAKNLGEEMIEHPESPLVNGNSKKARPGGRIINYNGQLVRFAQDCQPRYGTQLRAFLIDKLSESEYIEQEHMLSPILKPTGIKEDWNGERMHHADAHKLEDSTWIMCVDGLKSKL